MTDRLCPLCQSANTGGMPYSHKNSTERGRLDIDSWVCMECHASWQIYYYVREDVEENLYIRRGNGNRVEWGDLPPRVCRGCASQEVKYVQRDGSWHRPGTEILRYECRMCGEIWLEYVQVDDGNRLFWRRWKQGRK